MKTWRFERSNWNNQCNYKCNSMPPENDAMPFSMYDAPQEQKYGTAHGRPNAGNIVKMNLLQYNTWGNHRAKHKCMFFFMCHIFKRNTLQRFLFCSCVKTAQKLSEFRFTHIKTFLVYVRYKIWRRYISIVLFLVRFVHWFIIDVASIN